MRVSEQQAGRQGLTHSFLPPQLLSVVERHVSRRGRSQETWGPRGSACLQNRKRLEDLVAKVERWESALYGSFSDLFWAGTASLLSPPGMVKGSNEVRSRNKNTAQKNKRKEQESIHFSIYSRFINSCFSEFLRENLFLIGLCCAVVKLAALSYSPYLSDLWLWLSPTRWKPYTSNNLSANGFGLFSLYVKQ